MKQDNGSQIYNLIEKTDIRNVGVSFVKEKGYNDLLNSKKGGFSNFNQKAKSPLRNNDKEEEVYNNKRLNSSSNDNVKNKMLEEENQKLKNRIKAMEQAKSLAFNNDKKEEISDLKELLDKKEEEIEQLQSKYDKKNRENIENKSKSENFQFDNELLQGKIQVIFKLTL
jgi:hypothetical protein